MDAKERAKLVEFTDRWWRLVNSMAVLGYSYVEPISKGWKAPSGEYTQFRKLKEGIKTEDMFDKRGFARIADDDQFASMSDKDDLRFYTFAECEKFIREECEKTETNLKYINEYGKVIEVI